jgi:hypothetical protein
MDDDEPDQTDDGEETQDEQKLDQGESGILDPNSLDNVVGFFFPHDPDFGILPDSLLCLCGLTGKLVQEIGLALAHDLILF